MCGICGIIRFDGRNIDKKEIYEMNQLMVHRGPDEEGYYIKNGIGLGIRRLSIIDLESGHQPISNEDNRYIVILNGEIYNYLELREKLLKKGHVFSTKSDTEVIVHLFEEMGLNCVSELNGMFAFAIFDSFTKELLIYRDRIGIKPLFYTIDSNSFVFSSDLLSIAATKALKKEVDFNAFQLYLGLSYIPYPKTIFKDIYKLEPGHFIKVSVTGEIIKEKYWDIQKFETINLSTMADYHDLILTLLRDSIRLQMRSDVPIGTFLSGGIDSSCVVALLSEQVEKPVKTFSVGFNRGINELPYAKIVSEKFKTDHTELMISGEEILDILPEIIDKMDEPLSDNATIPTFMLSKIAIKKGVKVILNGTGGDEIFGGYSRYLPQKQSWRIINSLPINIRKLIGILFSHSDTDKGMRIANPSLSYIASVSGINFSFTKDLFKNKTHYESMLNNIINRYRDFLLPYIMEKKIYQLMYLDLKDYLVGDILSLLDKMTMAVSLEGRVPLLDHRIVETCFSIPDQIKFIDGNVKGLFKSTLKDILPDEILYLPKAGFAGPTKYWVNSVLKKSIYKHLVEKPIPFYKEYLDIDTIKRALENSERYWRYSETIFSLYIFSLWFQKRMEAQEIVI